jgi:hypothetical protein
MDVMSDAVNTFIEDINKHEELSKVI